MRSTARLFLCALVACLGLILPAIAADDAPMQPPTKEEADATRAQGRFLVTITMANDKTIEIVLEGAEAPYTVANFVKLVKAKYYDGLTFHNVVDDERSAVQLIHGGDPDGDGSGGPGYKLSMEIAPFLGNKRSAIAMMRRRGDNFGSQFIILRKDAPQLDGGFSVFGWVKSGMDVVDAVKPKDTMKTVTVAPYAGTEACPILAVYEPGKQPPTKAEKDAVEKQGRYLATITMENGKKIEMVLEGKLVPGTVANFIKLANAKFYDGLTFHRVETKDGFQLIQGGDPNGDGSGGPGYEIKLELAKELKHKTGALAMARSQDPNSAGCQFYITYCDIETLDGKYAVFGWVKTGLEVVKQVKVGDKMKSVTIAPYDGKEACPLSK